MGAHRCTVEQIAILEPALSETVAITMCIALREATDEAVRRGVPRQAAVDFMLGHLTIGLAIAFEIFPEGRFSDGALHAIEQAKPEIFREGWLERVFDPEGGAAVGQGHLQPAEGRLTESCRIQVLHRLGRAIIARRWHARSFSPDWVPNE